MPLFFVCNYIRDHRSLSNATIVSASTYAIWVRLVVKYRFLLLYLRRAGKKDVYLRLDRLRSEVNDLAAFMASGLQGPANDIVSSAFWLRSYTTRSSILKAAVSSNINELVKGDKWENTQVYQVPPKLGVFRGFCSLWCRSWKTTRHGL